jgi:hypothetical protein
MSRLALLLALACASCGGQSGTLSITIVVPMNDDPFAEAANAHIVVGNPAVVDQTVAVSGGHFNTSVKITPPSSDSTADVGQVTIEALDASGAVIAHGHSPPIAILAQDAVIAVWVGRVGKVGVAPSAFSVGRTEMAAVALPRLGALYAGGRASTGVVNNSEVYDVYSQQLVVASPIPSPRAGAVGLGFDRSDQATGAAMLVGGTSDATLFSTATQFDPLADVNGTWADVKTDDTLARDLPTIAALSDGSFLLSGGKDASGAPLTTATVVSSPLTLSIAATTNPMMAARIGHTATPVMAAGGAGVLLFGGAKTGPASELYLQSSHSFTAADLGMPSRTGHSATLLADGRVLVAGGIDDSGKATASGFLVTPSTLAVEKRPTLLATARTAHVAALAGGELVVCGGSDATGAPLATCEALDGTTLAHKRDISLAVGRSGASFIPVDSGDLILAGGVDKSGSPIPSIEIYTP